MRPALDKFRERSSGQVIWLDRIVGFMEFYGKINNNWMDSIRNGISSLVVKILDSSQRMERKYLISIY